ncbi:succinate dehydrogenase flavoprotein [Histoplasma capsulatum H143]|uniref:Succinate dehydrogenase flavoprotein n=1 Tax=Ajellomyces capsulatus (strain H143) TaxID=544712 RepID=C6HEJ9_AJECH|nr:succinate dehydrogenase flavoprotein [Histoplasma capsulatum H143]
MKLNDYRYEYELLARFWTSIQAAVPILINLPSALVGAGGAGLMAAVGLAQSGLETPCISKLQYICKEAPQIVAELERYGMPFSRTAECKIYQQEWTGHAMLHTLYGQALKIGWRQIQYVVQSATNA